MSKSKKRAPSTMQRIDRSWRRLKISVVVLGFLLGLLAVLNLVLVIARIARGE
jgi:hypothetical protein